MEKRRSFACMRLLTAFLSIVCAQSGYESTDSTESIPAVANSRPKVLQSIEYVKSFAWIDSAECNVYSLRRSTKRDLAYTTEEHSTYTLKDPELVFSPPEILFPNGHCADSMRVKNLYTSLYALMCTSAVLDASRDSSGESDEDSASTDSDANTTAEEPPVIGERMSCRIREILSRGVSPGAGLPAPLSKEAIEALGEELTWFCTVGCAKNSTIGSEEGISAVVALLLITNQYGRLSSAEQALATSRLRTVDIARFLALAILCQIPEGFLRHLPAIIEKKGKAGCQVLIAARAFLQAPIERTRNMTRHQSISFLEACLPRVHSDEAVPRSMWWYLHILIGMFNGNPLLPGARCPIIFSTDDASLAQHAAMRDAWPLLLWEEHMPIEARTFAAQMLCAFKHPQAAAHLPKWSAFFEWCVPDASFIPLVSRVLNQLYLDNRTYPAPAADGALFAQHAISYLQTLFSAWISNRTLPLATTDTLFAVLLDSHARDIVPSLVETFRTRRATFAQTEGVECTYLQLVPLPFLAPVKRPAVDKVLLSPLSAAATEWLAQLDTVINSTCGDNTTESVEYLRCMLTMELVPRIVYLWHALRHRYTGPRAHLDPACRPQRPLNIFTCYPYGLFVMYLTYNRTVLRVLDSVPVPAIDPENPPRPTAAVDPPQTPQDFFKEAPIDEICHGIADVWYAQLAAIAGLKVGKISWRNFSPKICLYKAHAQWPLINRLHFLAGLLASQRLRTILKTRLKDSTALVHVLRVIMALLSHHTAISAEELASIPALPPLFYTHADTSIAAMNATSMVALLRLSRFLLECMERPKVQCYEKAVKVQASRSMGYLAELLGREWPWFVTQELLVQLVYWLQMQDAPRLLVYVSLETSNGVRVHRNLHANITAHLGNARIMLSGGQRVILAQACKMLAAEGSSESVVLQK